MSRLNTWYEDMEAMQKDDEYLQRIYARLKKELSGEARQKVQHIHVYPSWWIIDGCKFISPDPRCAATPFRKSACLSKCGTTNNNLFRNV